VAAGFRDVITVPAATPGQERQHVVEVARIPIDGGTSAPGCQVRPDFTAETALRAITGGAAGRPAYGDDDRDVRFVGAPQQREFSPLRFCCVLGVAVTICPHGGPQQKIRLSSGIIGRSV